MEINNTRKLHVLVSKDITRAHNGLTSLYLDVEAKTLNATDGHALAIVPVVVRAGDVSGPVDPDAFEEAIKKSKSKKRPEASLLCEKDNTVEEFSGTKRPRAQIAGEFPNLRQCIPCDSGIGDENTLTVKINPKLLMTLAKAIGAEEAITLTFKLGTKPTSEGLYDDPIVARCDDDAGVLGCIMPMNKR